MKTVRMMMCVIGLALCLATLPALGASGTVKVFVLAGQSNMEGKASNALLEHQATDAKTKALFTHLRKDGKWIERDDVFIKFLNRKGPLTIGYGSPNKTGVELEFGHAVGNHYDEPVILIKAAWGGHSLYKLFRSPSAGMPSEAILKADLAKAIANTKKNNEKRKRNDPMPTMEDIKAPYGSSYRNMMKEVKDVYDNFETMFPALKGKKLEMAGFLWFQGFNDQFGEQAPAEYQSNMKHFINDVRKDLNAPKLPFVIAAIGTNGVNEAKGGGLAVRTAQMAMNDVPEFKGNVKSFRTDLLVDKAAAALYPKWKDNFELWKLTGSDRAYHYLGSAIWYNRIGQSFGKEMIKMLPKK